MKMRNIMRQDRLSVHLEEYKQLSSEIKLRVTFQQNLTNYQLIAVGVMVTLGIKLFDNEPSEALRYYLLLGPIIFMIFAWIHSTHDLMIINIAKYINYILRPKLNSLLADDVLSFEVFVKNERECLLRKWGPLAIFGQEFVLQFILPLVFLIIYINIFFIKDLSLMKISKEISFVRFAQFVLLNCDILLYLSTINLRYRVGKKYMTIID